MAKHERPHRQTPERQHHRNDLDFATRERTLRRFRLMQVRAAIAGLKLQRVQDPGGSSTFVLIQHDCTQQLDDLDGVADYLDNAISDPAAP